jgi:predicted tellurium resistance membrane protein TerC
VDWLHVNSSVWFMRFLVALFAFSSIPLLYLAYEMWLRSRMPEWRKSHLNHVLNHPEASENEKLEALQKLTIAEAFSMFWPVLFFVGMLLTANFPQFFFIPLTADLYKIPWLMWYRSVAVCGLVVSIWRAWKWTRNE